MSGTTIFDGPVPVAVPYKKGKPLDIPKRVGDEISFEEVDKKETPPKPGAGPTQSAPDDLDELQTLLDDKVDEAFDPDTGEPVGGEDALENEEGEEAIDDQEFEGPPINDLFEAEWIVEVVEEIRTSAFLSIYDWRGKIKKVRNFFRQLGRIQTRTDAEQKIYLELEKFIDVFGDERNALEDKIRWTDKFKHHLTRYLDHELSKFSDKRIPIWLYLLGMEGIALGRVATRDTHLDELPFDLPDTIEELLQKDQA